MNSRIQELAQQAGFGPSGDPYTRQAFDVGLFAELIVKECASLMYGRDENGNCKDGDTILEHFGVES